VAEIRRLIYELRPPALDELGLVPALQLNLAQMMVGGLKIELDTPPDKFPKLSAAAEVALYRITFEAITNVIRHAEAKTCLIRFWLPSSSLIQLEIIDDGRGGAIVTRQGVGLSSMKERAEELGGFCRIENRLTGGTHITVRLPIATSKTGHTSNETR